MAASGRRYSSAVMLKDRIIATIRFFDLQDYPITLLELEQFLVADMENLKTLPDDQAEIRLADPSSNQVTSAEQILGCLENECQEEIASTLGFYHIAGRKQIVDLRLSNYFYGIIREKLIRRHVKFLRHLPFVRGVALAGSQAMGQEKPTSDIDLLIITDAKFMWLPRTLVTAYFQILGLRRHGTKTQNRFCINHYLAGPKKISQLRNLYTASEYLKLRPLVHGHGVWQFQQENTGWLKVFFPNFKNIQPAPDEKSQAQYYLEKIFLGKFGSWLEAALRKWQLPKIRQEKFIVVNEDELSFHPDSKQQTLLSKFLEFQQ